jgi:hypothetical protein
MIRRFAPLLLLLAGCAVPVPPTGGPPDSTPPTLVASSPASGETGVETQELIFEFSEVVDEASFRNAFSLAPDIEGNPEIRRSGRSIRVRLPEPLRAATTYRVTLDVTLRDARRVALDAPLTIAFSTGESLDRARLSGRVVGALDGKALRGIDILAFAAPDSASLAAGPLYRTQTGSDGAFQLEYLAPGAYFVVGVEDGNRNRRVDATEALALPPVWPLAADTSFSAPEEPWVLSRRDATAPVLDRVRAVSDAQLELRFSEPLALSLDAPFPIPDLVLTDSIGTSVSVTGVWPTAENPRTLLAAVDALRPGRWTLTGSVDGVDSLGNAVEPVAFAFDVREGLPPPDPTSLLGWLPDSLESGTPPRVLWPIESVGLRLSRPDGDARITRSDTSGTRTEVLEPVDATLYRLADGWSGGEPFQISVELPGADSAQVKTFRLASDREVGALGVVVEAGGARVRGELRPAGKPRAPVRVRTLETGTLLFEGLPAGWRGVARVFVDRDGDGTWSAGSLLPFVPAEPVQWVAFREAVRARWDTIAPDTLRFQAAAPEAEDG